MVGLTTVEEEMSPCFFPLTLTAAEFWVLLFSLEKCLHMGKLAQLSKVYLLANKKVCLPEPESGPTAFSELSFSHVVHSFSAGMKLLI